MIALLAALALAAGGTQVHVYKVSQSAHMSRIARGSCFSGSGASRRADAWRCTVGNEIYDPCFFGATTYAPLGQYVLCPAPPPAMTAVKIVLTKPLPRAEGNKGKGLTRGDPWTIVLTGGKTCVFLTGATAAIGGKRINYGCRRSPSAGFLVGDPTRGQTWTIGFATSLKGPVKRVAIAAVWF